MKLLSPPRETTLVAAFISIERLANLAKKLGSYLWGGNTVVGGLTDAQKKLAEGMRTFWSNLTTHGGPTGPSNWPAFTAEALQRIVFLEGGRTELISEDQYRKNHRCDLFASKSN